ncbi:MAG: signal peptidase II [Thiomonas sp.]|uniref:signal peptidase II n=1 Tax=Thiomonas sp. TaxID=2047785 RepID=UPI002A359E2E|nr:signal peptidase II [Thiomonas sp.]MDY0330984.1 signal peptidase II [Thiomonas sp.]
MPSALSDASFVARRARVWPWLLVSLAVILADQFTKWLVRQDLPLDSSHPVTGFFNLVYIHNPGAAFSFLAAAPGWQRWFFTALSLAASLFILWLMFRNRGKALFSLALAFILGGALGNVIDRVLWGKVTDFLDFYLTLGGQQWHWPAFNLADSAIFVGAVLLIVDEFRRARQRRS